MLLLVSTAVASATCDSMDFSQFPVDQVCEMPVRNTNLQAFQVSQPSTLTGGFVKLNPGVVSVTMTFWTAPTTSWPPSFAAPPVFSWVLSNPSVSSTSNVNFTLPGGSTYPLKVGTLYGFAVLGLNGTNSNDVVCLNGTFPQSSVQETYQLVGASYCIGQGPECVPNFQDGYPALMALAPIICNHCSGKAFCQSCTSTGCAWCEDNNACGVASTSCRTQITNPKYCPPVACSSIYDCSDCASESSCVWCINTKTCQDFHNTTCENRIGNPSGCAE